MPAARAGLVFLVLLLGLAACNRVGTHEPARYTVAQARASWEAAKPHIIPRERLWELLRAGEFDAIEVELGALLARSSAGELDEYVLQITVPGAFDVNDPELAARIEEWATARPDQAMARAARGILGVRRVFDILGQWRPHHERYPEVLRLLQEPGRAAVADLRRAVELEPDFHIAASYLIIAGRILGERELMDEGLEKALGAAPDSYYARVNYIYALEPQWGGSYEEMRAFAKQGQSHAAARPRLIALLGYEHWTRGATLFRKGKFAEAERAYSQALDRAPMLDWLHGRAKARWRQGDYGTALQDLDLLLEFKPEHIRARTLRASVKAGLGRFEDAMEDSRIALELEPDNGWALGNQGWLLLQVGRYAEAERPLARAVEHHPWNRYSWLNLGKVYLQLERPEEARDVFLRVVEMSERSSSGWVRLGESYEALGDLDAAAKSYRRYLELVDRDKALNQPEVARISEFLATHRGEGAVDGG